MKITLLSGSVVGTKTQTTMTIMQKKIQEQYPEASVTLLDLKQLTLQFSDGRNYLDYTDDTRFVTTTLMDSDIILIGSPTFQASIPGTLKNVFDLLCLKCHLCPSLILKLNGLTTINYIIGTCYKGCIVTQ